MSPISGIALRTSSGFCQYSVKNCSAVIPPNTVKIGDDEAENKSITCIVPLGWAKKCLVSQPTNLIFDQSVLDSFTASKNTVC